MATHAYLRQSSDPNGDELAVERQRHAVEALGLPVDRWWVDNDVSATRGRRPAFEALLSALSPGDVLLVYRLDRLARQPRDLERLLTLAEGRVKVRTVEGDVRLDTPDGRLLARLLVNVASHEVEVKAARQRARTAQKIRDGAPLWNNRVPRGYRRVAGVITIDEGEAAQLRDARLRIVQGQSVRSVARQLDITHVGLRLALMSATYLGHVTRFDRQTNSQVVVAENSFPAIFTQAEHDEVVRVLSDPTRRTASGSEVVHLLSGIARCEQGHSMRHAAGRKRGDAYWCPDCFVRRQATGLEGFVVDRVLDLLVGRHQEAPVEPSTADVDALRAERGKTIDLLRSGLLTADEARPLLEALQRRENAAVAAIQTQVTRRSALGAAVASAAHWETLSLPERRALIRSTVSVTVLKVGRGARLAYGEGVRVEPLVD